MSKQPNPLMIDLSFSVGYGLYYLPFIGNLNDPSYPFAEKFYDLHQKSLRSQVSEDRLVNKDSQDY